MQVRRAEGNSVCVQGGIWALSWQTAKSQLPLQMCSVSLAVPCTLFMEWHVLDPPVYTKTRELVQPFAWTSSDFPAGNKS